MDVLHDLLSSCSLAYMIRSEARPMGRWSMSARLTGCILRRLMAKKRLKRNHGKRHCLMKTKRLRNRLNWRIKKGMKLRKRPSKMTNCLGRKVRSRKRYHTWRKWIL